MSRAEDERDPAEVSQLRAAICVGVLFLGAIEPPPAQAGCGRVLTTSDVVRIRVLSQPDLDTTAPRQDAQATTRSCRAKAA